MATAVRTTRRTAAFQQWQALLGNRTKRNRSRAFVVQGVRPLTRAVERGWPVRTLIDDGRPPSTWAQRLLRTVDAERTTLSPELFAELAGKEEATGELLAVVGMPPDDLDRIPAVPRPLVVVFDRPTSPGNLGTLVRSADALGATAVVVTGHAADPYDPKCVRASTGSLFDIPVVRAGSHAPVLAWTASQRDRGMDVTVVGTDETGEVDVWGCDLTGPLVVVVGNETAGMSSAWRAACDTVVRIPMSGEASSLNAASAGTVLLYEGVRQRRGRHLGAAGPSRPGMPGDC